MDSQRTKFRPVNTANVCKNIMLDRMRRSSRLARALVDTIYTNGGQRSPDSGERRGAPPPPPPPPPPRK
ncbi:hypothetical protein V9T40_007507 [Parthenolecanium corni]|uniref:Uncharacterized protein n=1 Tax=Parthenolecanium corni TaxID=536013 RepID=A0AAN9TH68_9HEMI